MAKEPVAALGLLSSLSDRLATPQEARLLDQLRAELEADLAAAPAFPDVVGDLRLLRTLRGFDHAVPEAAAAFRAHLEVRRVHGLDAVRARILAAWEGRLWDLRCEALPHGELICGYMPEVLTFARSCTGDPIGLGLWGRGRPAAFVHEVDGWQEKFLEYYVHMNEARMLLLDQASREQNRLAHFVQVFDLEHWNVMGNADRSWTVFATEHTAPIGETYHDCHVNFLAIRTTRWAKMAYSVIKPLLPQKVTEKVHVLGDDFAAARIARRLLDELTLERLSQRSFELPTRHREGTATIRPRQSFELQVEVPCNGALCWNFGIEVDSLLRQHCFLGPAWWLSSDLLFSLRPGGGAAGAACEELLEDWKPHRVEGDGVSGRLGPLGAGAGSGAPPRTVVLRWDNRGALVSTKLLHYRVEVHLPVVRGEGAAPTSEAGGRVKSPSVARHYYYFVLCIVSLAVVALAVLCGRLVTSRG